MDNPPPLRPFAASFSDGGGDRDTTLPGEAPRVLFLQSPVTHAHSLLCSRISLILVPLISAPSPWKDYGCPYSVAP